MTPPSPSPLKLQVSPRELRLDVPSDLGMVGDAVELVTNGLPAGLLSPRRVRFNVRTALAEALANAILYGNGADPAKVVRVRVELARDAVRIHVTDDGAGFDPAALPDPTDPSNLDKEYGRGLLLIRTFMDEVRHNPRANQITMIKRRGQAGPTPTPSPRRRRPG